MYNKLDKPLFFYGASGHGKVILEIAETLGVPVNGFIDRNPAIHSLYKYPVLRELPNECYTLISIGNNFTRKLIAENLEENRFINLIHPCSNISKRCEIGKGTAIMAGVTINSDAQIGKHCIINTNASVDHESRLSDYIHISPNAAIAGDVTIGEGTHIGIGACVIQGVKIGKWVTVGAGAVILRDVPDYAVVVGNPGKILKYNEF